MILTKAPGAGGHTLSDQLAQAFVSLNTAGSFPTVMGAYSALLGIIVIQSIASGLTLLDLSSALRYMITGGVLAIAVIVDALARRSRVSHGRA